MSQNKQRSRHCNGNCYACVPDCPVNEARQKAASSVRPPARLTPAASWLLSAKPRARQDEEEEHNE